MLTRAHSPNVVSRLERVRSHEVQNLTDDYSLVDAELLADAPESDEEDDDIIIVDPPQAAKSAQPEYEPFAPSQLEHIRILPAPRSVRLLLLSCPWCSMLMKAQATGTATHSIQRGAPVSWRSRLSLIAMTHRDSLDDARTIQVVAS